MARKFDVEKVVDVTYVSEWDQDILIKTRAKLDWDTGVMVYVEVSESEVDGTLTREFIEFDDGYEMDIDSEQYQETGELRIANQTVVSSNGEKGYVVKEDEDGDCGVESCNGTVYLVRWLDGEVTACCGKGLSEQEDGSWKTA